MTKIDNVESLKKAEKIGFGGANRAEERRHVDYGQMHFNSQTVNCIGKRSDAIE